MNIFKNIYFNYRCAWQRIFDFKGRSGRLECFTLIFINIFIPALVYSIIYKIFALLFFLSFLLPSICTEMMENLMIALPGILDYLVLLLSFVILMPAFSVSVRRFHDLGLDGRWSIIGSVLISLFVLIPNNYVAQLDLIWYIASNYTVVAYLVLLLVFLIICALPGVKYANQYGCAYIPYRTSEEDDEFIDDEF